MFVEESFVAPSCPTNFEPLSNFTGDEPIGVESGGSPSVSYTSGGLVIVGSENASVGQFAIVTDLAGSVVAFAFDDGDGNLSNELNAVGNGLACIGGAATTAVSSGSLAIYTGVATAGACTSFVASLGTLLSEYSNPPYTQSLSLNLESGVTTYTYDYAGRGHWAIKYDPSTDSWSE